MTSKIATWGLDKNTAAASDVWGSSKPIKQLICCSQLLNKNALALSNGVIFAG